MDSSALPNDPSADFTLPALLPPPMITSKFTNPVTRAKDLTITCMTFVVICVIIRFYTKLHIKNAWGWEDCRSPFWLDLDLADRTQGFAYLP